MTEPTGRVVPEASAVLALLGNEPGAEVVPAALDGLDLDPRPFDTEAAYVAGALRPVTRAGGLGFGDRACLALAAKLGGKALTADRGWAALSGPIPRVILLR